MDRRTRIGFTLTEMLVVITLIGILMAFAVPAVLGARARALRGRCEANQGQLAKAIMSQEARKGYPGYRECLRGTVGTSTAVYVGWPILMLPDLGRQDLWMACRTATTQTTLATALQSAPTLEEFRCPADPRTFANPLSYVANCGRPDAGTANNIPPDWPANGVFHNLGVAKSYQVQMRSSDVKDGTAATILFTENTEERTNTNYVWNANGNAAVEAYLGVLWYPTATDAIIINEKKPKNVIRPSSSHAGGVIVSFCDGHQQFIRESINWIILTRLLAPCDNEIKDPGKTTAPAIKSDVNWTRAIVDADYIQ